MYTGRVIRNLNALTADDRRWAWEQANATHLKAPLESVDLHFMVEGVARALTHQDGPPAHSGVRAGEPTVRSEGGHRRQAGAARRCEQAGQARVGEGSR